MEAEREPLLPGAQPTVPANNAWRKLSPRRIAIGLTLALAISPSSSSRPFGAAPRPGSRNVFAPSRPRLRRYGANGACGATKVRQGWRVAGRGKRRMDFIEDIAGPLASDRCTSDSPPFLQAFTSLLVGQLVEQGKLSWTTPVTSLHPVSFEDPIASSQPNLIDILSHQTGLPRHDLLFLLWNTTEDYLARVRYLEPTDPFRSKWQYNNWMFELAGAIVRNVTGQATWAAALRDGILDPLNMTNTIASIFDLAYTRDHARAFDDEGNIMPYEAEGLLSAVTAAGAISTSANEGSQWLRALLGRGTLSGTTLVEDATFEQLTKPHKTTDKPHALGWFIADYRGHHSVTHGGTTLGFNSQVRFFPDDDLAYIVMTNTNSPGPSLVLNEVISERLLFPEIPGNSKWSVERKEQFRAAEEMARHLLDERKASRLNGTSPSHPLDDYPGLRRKWAAPPLVQSFWTFPCLLRLGTYTHPAYGRVKITRPTPTSPTLHARCINPGATFDFDLDHWHLDEFAISSDFEFATEIGNIVFETEAATGAVQSLVIPLESALVAGERGGVVMYQRHPPRRQL
ncbi:beta-lactamase/transpeptidase-like protein [Blyttiomyces helicus]|uniref:Beta-lactamase/transpeptidase-like protein n=1 Tax=Blyttiomyces helicus TaxID=388810 RepID=A0A4P9W9G8_9FUNG|nr:beta-lactamase/transpeptidase-like protein [Blyttiomyces helicus]|eukprot:RKO87440.1 beta-lactamase/transpeptidase-like protein [Blyttiomyces helicus]